jgi:hypothetical protein
MSDAIVTPVPPAAGRTSPSTMVSSAIGRFRRVAPSVSSACRAVAAA